MNDDRRSRLALVSLGDVGPARARWLLDGREASAVVARLKQGRLPPDIAPAPPGVTRNMITRWTAGLRAQDLDDVERRHRDLGIDLVVPSDSRWPFNDDPEPPVLLFCRGDLELLTVPWSVAVVGTRRCTAVGRTVAYQLGRDLAAAGVGVVSGLALGIDGSAHRGTLDHGGVAIAVVGSGLDVVYPGANRTLWEDVASTGLLIGEAPAGTKPARWRFPARNRLIAGLSDGVVIVESHRRGGALMTADEAIDRGRSVFALPGSVLSPASEGTNALLLDGATPARHAADVLGHLGLGMTPHGEEHPPPGTPAPQDESPEEGGPEEAGPEDLASDVTAVETGVPPGPRLAQLIMAEVSTGPVHVDTLVHVSGFEAVEVLAAVQGLVASGVLVQTGSTVSLGGPPGG